VARKAIDLLPYHRKFSVIAVATSSFRHRGGTEGSIPRSHRADTVEPRRATS